MRQTGENKFLERFRSKRELKISTSNSLFINVSCTTRAQIGSLHKHHFKLHNTPQLVNGSSTKTVRRFMGTAWRPAQSRAANLLTHRETDREWQQEARRSPWSPDSDPHSGPMTHRLSLPLLLPELGDPLCLCCSALLTRSSSVAHLLVSLSALQTAIYSQPASSLILLLSSQPSHSHPSSLHHSLSLSHTQTHPNTHLHSLVVFSYIASTSFIHVWNLKLHYSPTEPIILATLLPIKVATLPHFSCLERESRDYWGKGAILQSHAVS